MTIKMSLAAIAALALATPAMAEHGEAVIAFADLDLSSASGTARLERRVKHAAVDICGEMPSRGIAERMRVAACHNEVKANAAAQLEPVLEAARAGNISLARR